jgi:hypothetical protein
MGSASFAVGPADAASGVNFWKGLPASAVALASAQPTAAAIFHVNGARCMTYLAKIMFKAGFAAIFSGPGYKGISDP